MATDDAPHPAQLLDEVRRLRECTREQAHAGAWLPVAALALLLLASIALYEMPFAEPTHLEIMKPYWAGLPDQQRSAGMSYIFWFVGTPLTIALIGAWYRWRARRVGIRVPWGRFAVTALGAQLALAVLAAAPVTPVADPSMLTSPETSMAEQILQGLFTPLLPIALALVVLGWSERSRAVALSGVWVGVIAWWQCSNAYLGQLPGWATWVLGGFQGPALGGQLTLFGLNRPGPTLVLMALPLLLFAVIRAVRTGGGMR